MTNKEVCKACVNREANRTNSPTVWRWNCEDEKEWLDGRVLCPGEKWGLIWLKYGLPESCLYLAEHVVSQDVE